MPPQDANPTPSFGGFGLRMPVAGMILGIVAIVFAFIPIFGAFISIPCVGVGLPLAAISFFQARKREQPLGMSIAGLATTIVALFITTGWMVVLAVAAASTS